MKPILKQLYQNSRNEEIKYLIFDAFNKDNVIRSNVSKYKNTPDYILERLSNDENVNVRTAIASNQRTPISILEKLSNDKEARVRYWVIQNINWINRNKNP